MAICWWVTGSTAYQILIEQSQYLKRRNAFIYTKNTYFWNINWDNTIKNRCWRQNVNRQHINVEITFGNGTNICNEPRSNAKINWICFDLGSLQCAQYKYLINSDTIANNGYIFLMYLIWMDMQPFTCGAIVDASLVSGS